MTVQGISGLRIGLIGPLPPTGMANQTRQLAERLTTAVLTESVNAHTRNL